MEGQQYVLCRHVHVMDGDGGKKYTLYSVDEILKPRSLELSLDPQLSVEGGFLDQSGRLIMLGN